MRYQVRSRGGRFSRLLFTCQTEETATMMAAGAEARGIPTRILRVRKAGA